MTGLLKKISQSNRIHDLFYEAHIRVVIAKVFVFSILFGYAYTLTTLDVVFVSTIHISHMMCVYSDKDVDFISLVHNFVNG